MANRIYNESSYIEGLRRAAKQAILCQAYDSATILLDLGLSYGFPEGLPKEALFLWDAKLALDIAKLTIDKPEYFTDPSKLWEETMNEACLLLGVE